MNTKMKTRLFSLMICVVMLVGLMPTTALASDNQYWINIAGGTVTDGLGDANGPNYTPGTSVTITAAAPSTGKKFGGWDIHVHDDAAGELEFTAGDETTSTATFKMPASTMYIESKYIDIEYNVNVVNGTIKGSSATTGKYVKGALVNIEADEHSLAYMGFYEWLSNGITDTYAFMHDGANTKYFTPATFTMPAKDVTVTASYGVCDITATTTEVKPVLGNDARVELDFTFIPGLSDMVEVDGNWQYAADGSDWANVSKYNNYAFNTFIPGYWRYTIDVEYKSAYAGMKFCKNGIVTVNGEEWERVASVATQASAYSPTYYLDSEGNVSVDLIEITKVEATYDDHKVPVVDSFPTSLTAGEYLPTIIDFEEHQSEVVLQGNGKWQKKNGSAWEDASGKVAAGATYRFKTTLKMHSDNSSHTLADNVKLTVDGVSWTVDTATMENKGTKDAGVTVYSPEITVPAATTYTVTVNNGTGGGNYAEGASVTVTADAAPAGKTFKEWQIEGLSITASPSNPLTFDMPANNVTLTATYVEEGGLIESASATIPVPVAGAAPSDCAVVSDEASKYTATVVKWERIVSGVATTLGEDDTFIRGEDYRVYVRFAAKPGYEFASSANYKINGRTVYAPDPADTSVLRTEFNDIYEIIDNVKIKGVIAPVAGAAPDVSGITSDTEGVNITSAEWKDQWVTDSVVTFEAGKKYKLVIKYSLDTNYKVADGAEVTFNISDNITDIKLVTKVPRSISMMYEVPAATTYTVTVTGGTASPAGPYTEGTEVIVTANPDPEGKKFKEWQIEGLSTTTSESISVFFYMPANNVTITAIYEKANIIIESASATITEPVVGANPDFNIVSADESKYTVTVVKWNLLDGSSYPVLTAGDKFVRGESYQLDVKFVANPGYEFSDSCVYNVNGVPRAAYSLIKGERRCYFDVYEIIDTINVKGVVAPVAGATPDVSGITSDTDGIKVMEVKWRDKDGYAFEGNQFVAGEKYILWLKYEIESDYKVADDAEVTFNISDSNILDKKITHPIIQMTYEVPAAKTPVDTVNISGLAKPVVGEMPDNSITVNGTGVTAADDGSYWGRFDSSRFNPYYDDDTAVVSEPFREGETYLFQLYLYAEDGYEFTEETEFYFAGKLLPAPDMSDLSKSFAMVNPEDSSEALVYINMNDIAHVHVPGDWDHNDTHHWRKCTASGCDAASDVTKLPDYAEHSFVGGICTCGAHQHNWSAEWSVDETHHWHECTAGGCTATDNSGKAGYAAHNFVGGECECGVKNVITSIEISGITAPVVGETPDNSASVDKIGAKVDEEYTFWVRYDASTGNIRDTYEDGTFVFETPFREGEIYLLYVMINLSSGYRLAANVNILYDGNVLPYPDPSNLTISCADVSPDGSAATAIINPTGAAPVPVTLDSIEVTTPPTKTEYTAGEIFDPAGMVVTATYSDNSTAPVTGFTVSPAGALEEGNTTITVTYTEEGVIKTATLDITVSAKKYSVTAETADGGKLTVSPEGGIREGETVTVKATPNDGYTLISMKVYDASGSFVCDVVGGSFTMPASNVTVRAEFEKELPNPVRVVFDATVVLNGAELEAGAFTFELSYGGRVIQTLKNPADGKMTFAPIVFTSIGSDVFYIRQIKGSADFVEYDETVYAVTVNVTLNEDDGLVAEVIGDAIVFTNTYIAPEDTTAPEETTEEPEVTTEPEETTEEPEITTAPEETTEEPEITTAPEQTTEEPEITTAPEVTTEEPEITTAPEETTEEPEVTTAPEETTEEPEVTTAPEETQPENPKTSDNSVFIIIALIAITVFGAAFLACRKRED